MRIARICRWFFPLLCSTAVTAQTTTAIPEGINYSFRNLDNRNGLFGNDVNSIAQDQTGYMWIGGAHGLQRYDGFRFVSYIDTSGVQTPTTAVTTVSPDRAKNRILYNVFNGQMLQRDMFTGRASWVYPSGELDKTKEKTFTDHKGDAWLRQEYVVTKVSADGRFREGIQVIAGPYQLRPFFASFWEDVQRGVTWTTDQDNGILRFDNRSHQVTMAQLDPAGNQMFALLKDAPLSIRSIRPDTYGNLWMIGWGNELFRYNQDDQQLYKYSVSSVIRSQNNKTVSNGWVNDILQDNHGRIWIATAHAGLLEYLPQQDRFAYTLSNGTESSLQYNLELVDLYQDRDENIWVATDRGISIFNPYRQYFGSLVEARERGDLSLRYEVSTLLSHSGGDLLLGMHGGGIAIFNANGQFGQQLQFTGKDERLVWSMAERNNGDTWVGCQHGVVHILDAAYKLVKTEKPRQLLGSTVRCMGIDREGDIFFGLHNGAVVVWNHKTGMYSDFDPVLPAGMTRSAVINLYFDREGQCWVGTMGGLALFDRNTNRFTAFYKPVSNTGTSCSGIDELNDSTLVLGMDNAGLVYFNKRSHQFTLLPLQADGSPWSVQAVKKDSAGSIWFTSNLNVYRYNPVSKELVMNTPDNGLMNSTFSSPRFVTLSNGDFATATRTEAVFFSPATLAANTSTPDQVRITGLRVFEQRHLVDSLLHHNAPISLGYKDNFITIEFSDLRFSGSLKTRYFYRLSGVDNDWVDAGSKSFAGYTNLSPGKYRFMVTSGSPSNEKSMGYIDLVIVPPFWATTWFRLLVIILAIALVIVTVRWYINRIRHESDMKRQIATTEMMALRAQMNPHFIFNCINSIDAMIQQDDKYQATVYLNKFARLIRNILDSSRQQTISFRKDLEALQLYVELEQFRSGNSFSAEITTDESIAQNDIKVPPLIIQPYVENAILHGLKNRDSSDGKLKIDIFTEDDQLVYVIEDNGVGRAASATPARKHRSYGMDITGDRLRLFNNKEEVAPVTVTDLMKDGQASGTRVQVSLKIKYA